MMIYKIDNTVAFRSDDGVMWNILQPERKLSLSTTPARLLEYLLENKDKIVERDELLNNIWDKYGLEPSNNSVNQYISLIRKSFLELGCDAEVVKTLPKIGYYVSSELISGFEKVQVVGTDLNLQSCKKKPINFKWAPPLFFAIGVFFSLFLVLQPFYVSSGQMDYSFPKSKLYPIGSILNCPLYSLSEVSPQAAIVKEKLAQELATLHAPCLNNEVFIFKAEEDFVFEKVGRAFIARCSNSEVNLSHFSDCKAVYVYNK